MLVPAYEKLKALEPQIPPSLKSRIREAHQRVIDLYEAWGKADQADRWRATLKYGDQPNAPGAPASRNPKHN
jgi:hypothetical protein